MKHLDEGTIHAWLDGALDSAQSREIETHVAQCTTCSAAVAEARGLVAASSRILNALDDVPGGVVPKRAAPVVKPAKRQWRAAPWVSAIAATLVIAVGVARLSRDEQLASTKATASADSAPVAASQLDRRVNLPVSQAPAAPAPFAVARETAPPARTRSVVASIQNERPDSTRGAIADRRADAAVAATADTRAVGEGGGVRRELAAGAPSAPTAAAEPAEQKLDKSVKSAAPAPSAPPATRLALDEAVVTGARDAAGKRSDADVATGRLAGCYRMLIIGSGAMQRAEGATTRSAAARGAQQPAAANFASPSVPSLVRLDTAQRRLGMPVVGAYSDSIVGWWNRIGPDTADVRLVAGVAVTLLGKNRVPCPER